MWENPHQRWGAIVDVGGAIVDVEGATVDVEGVPHQRRGAIVDVAAFTSAEAPPRCGGVFFSESAPARPATASARTSPVPRIPEARRSLPHGEKQRLERPCARLLFGPGVAASSSSRPRDPGGGRRSRTTCRVVRRDELDAVLDPLLLAARGRSRSRRCDVIVSVRYDARRRRSTSRSRPALRDPAVVYPPDAADDEIGRARRR